MAFVGVLRISAFRHVGDKKRTNDATYLFDRVQAHERRSYQVSVVTHYRIHVVHSTTVLGITLVYSSP